jgi:hypothetical protein
MPRRTRAPLHTPLKRPSLALLSDKEISGCLKRAFDSLSKQDQTNVEVVLEGLMSIPNMGLRSALRVLFVIHQGDELDRLDAVLKGGARKS